MKMQILQNNNWVDVWTRARTIEGKIRVYKRFLRENKNGSPPVCGMRLITIHGEHLGVIIGKENPFKILSPN